MLPYAADLVKMKAKGNSHGQMLSWLHGQGVYANLAEISSFWSFHALQKQKTAPTICKNPPGHPNPQPSSGTESKSKMPVNGPDSQNLRAFVSSCEPVPPEWLHETDKNVQQLTAWFRDHAAPDLGILMNLYKSMLFNLLRKGDTSPESFQQVQQMTRTVISYEQNKTRLELRRETLNRQKAEPEPKAAKVPKPPTDQTAAEQSAAANPTISDLTNILSAIMSRQLVRRSPAGEGGSPATADLSTETLATLEAQKASPDLPPENLTTTEVTATPDLSDKNSEKEDLSESCRAILSAEALAKGEAQRAAPEAPSTQPAAVAADPTLADLSAILSRHSRMDDGGNLPAPADPSSVLSAEALAKAEASTKEKASPSTLSSQLSTKFNPSG